MSTYTPFMPKRGANIKTTASTASASSTLGKGQKSIRVANASTVVIYFRTYNSADEPTATASTADTPVLPASAASSTLIIEKPQDHDSVCYISDSGTGNVVHFQVGEGAS